MDSLSRSYRVACGDCLQAQSISRIDTQPGTLGALQDLKQVSYVQPMQAAYHGCPDRLAGRKRLQLIAQRRRQTVMGLIARPMSFSSAGPAAAVDEFRNITALRSVPNRL